MRRYTLIIRAQVQFHETDFDAPLTNEMAKEAIIETLDDALEGCAPEGCEVLLFRELPDPNQRTLPL